MSQKEKKRSNKSEKQENIQQKLPLGKLKTDLLQSIFQEYSSPEIMGILKTSGTQKLYDSIKERVEVGFAIGEDAAAIDMGDKYLISKTDPITFTSTSTEIGYYAVNVNANDIACMGATPKWFQATILLPEGIATPEMAKEICVGIQKACLNIGVFLIGGHTEVTYEITRPLVIGSMLGEVPKNKLVKSSGGKPGDALILTKGVPIEGSAIIATEKKDDLLKKGINQTLIDKAKGFIYNPGLSIMKEALLASQNFDIHAMHDPTEGGLAMGLVELALASKCGVLVKKEDIPIVPEGEILCKAFNLDPLNVISSGALLVAVNEKQAQSVLELFKKNNIIAKKIGNLTDSQQFKIEINGKIENLRYSEKDQITEIL